MTEAPAIAHPHVEEPAFDQVINPVDRAKGNTRIDELERVMMQMPPADCPVTHHFTPGLYIREIFMPAGAIVTSKIHRTEHPFVISQGKVAVKINDGQWQELSAPFCGITRPGTRRVLMILEDTVWTTFHPTQLTDVAEIEEQIIEPHRAHIAGMVQPTQAQFQGGQGTAALPTGEEAGG